MICAQAAFLGGGKWVECSGFLYLKLVATDILFNVRDRGRYICRKVGKEPIGNMNV